MAENPAAKFSTALDEVITTREQKTGPELKQAIEERSDTLWRESWAYHCAHQLKHLDAIALTDPDNKEIQARVALLKEVVARMRDGGMGEIVGITASTEIETELK